MQIATPLRLLILVARLLVAPLEGSNTLALRLFGVAPHNAERITQAEIRRVLSEGLSVGALLSFERSMMERVFDLDYRSIRTVMTGRRYIDLLPTGLDADKLRGAALIAPASRLLVAEEGNLDKLVGIVSRADVLAGLARGENVDLSAIAVYLRVGECQRPERSRNPEICACPRGHRHRRIRIRRRARHARRRA